MFKKAINLIWAAKIILKMGNVATSLEVQDTLVAEELMLLVMWRDSFELGYPHLFSRKYRVPPCHTYILPLQCLDTPPQQCSWSCSLL
jgi:hypothetical protein